MIIEFSVTNFRSIREKQTISFVADTDKSLPDNLQPIDVPGLRKSNLVKSAILYGANASGKSSLLKAMQFMRDFVLASATRRQPGEIIEVTPFIFDKATAEEASTFELVFLIENIRYEYGFTVNTSIVLDEWLIAYPKGKPQRWFERHLLHESSNFNWFFGPSSGIDHNLKKRTRDNVLFLSLGAQFNETKLLLIYEWFRTLRFLEISEALMKHLGLKFTAFFIENNQHVSELIKTLIKQSDFRIDDIVVERRLVIDEDTYRPPRWVSSETLDKLNQLPHYDIHFVYHYSNQKLMSLSEESEGTKNLFMLLGYWLDSLFSGEILVIDEIDTSLHPLLIKSLIAMFHDPKVNTKGAQLLCTTHDTTLLDQELFRRDQIWFVEKDAEGASNFYPLTDFSPRKGEALQKGYLAGRYGAIPYIKSGALTE